MPETQEQNDRLTRIGPGTPMGDLLRRYWHPVGTAPELADEPVRAVRILGEDLTLFRSLSGGYGLIGARCPHRRASLEYGIPQEDGLRCAYHGWMFDRTGRCQEQPFEDTQDPAGRGKSGIRTPAYPAQELGGLIFAYLGPEPAPLLPRWDLLVRDDLERVIEVNDLPCNWLQCVDNAVDPVHAEHLHGVYGNYVAEKLGLPPKMRNAPHVKIEFELFKYGIIKRRLRQGQSEDHDEWTVGHPLLFPNTLAVGTAKEPTLQFRVPNDDVNTTQYGYRTRLLEAGTKPRPLAVDRVRTFDDNGKLLLPLDNIPAQDMLAWPAQGAISDRTQEHLARSDRGVIMFHRLLEEQMQIIERGGDPMGVIRDPKENEPEITIPRERTRAFTSLYGDYFQQLADSTTAVT